MAAGSRGGPPDTEKGLEVAWGEPRVEGDARGEVAEPGPVQVAEKIREAQARNKMDWMMNASPEASGFGRIIAPDAALDAVHPDVGSGVHLKRARVMDDGAPEDTPGVAGTPAQPDAGEAAQLEAGARAVGAQGQHTAKTEPEKSAPEPRLGAVVSLGVAANERPPSRPASYAPARRTTVLPWLAVAAATGAIVLAWPRVNNPKGGVADAQTSPLRAPAGAGAEGVQTPAEGEGAAQLGRTETGSVVALGSKVDLGSGEPALAGRTDDRADPREPPPGTSPGIAAVFRKLPVSPADRAPVGGVGASGIHIDRISMGTQYENGKCSGEAERFSVSAGLHPSVCVRVVHPREKEELVVQWDKRLGATRRGKLRIKAAHAYRTRAYLVLRNEYIGDWTVRISSKNGVELAAYPFSVVP